MPLLLGAPRFLPLETPMPLPLEAQGSLPKGTYPRVKNVKID